jgi:hypothetical protein
MPAARQFASARPKVSPAATNGLFIYSIGVDAIWAIGPWTAKQRASGEGPDIVWEARRFSALNDGKPKTRFPIVDKKLSEINRSRLRRHG